MPTTPTLHSALCQTVPENSGIHADWTGDCRWPQEEMMGPGESASLGWPLENALCPTVGGWLPETSPGQPHRRQALPRPRAGRVSWPFVGSLACMHIPTWPGHGSLSPTGGPSLSPVGRGWPRQTRVHWVHLASLPATLKLTSPELTSESSTLAVTNECTHFRTPFIYGF